MTVFVAASHYQASKVHGAVNSPGRTFLTSRCGTAHLSVISWDGEPLLFETIRRDLRCKTCARLIAGDEAKAERTRPCELCGSRRAERALSTEGGLTVLRCVYPETCAKRRKRNAGRDTARPGVSLRLPDHPAAADPE